MVKLLYYVSYVLSAPFYLVSWIFYGLTFISEWVGDMIFDNTTNKLWLIMFRRALKKWKVMDK